MAVLYSEEIDCPSSLELRFLEKHKIELPGQDECWQRLILVLHSGEHEIVSMPGENVSICRTPGDELATLIEQLDLLLAGRKEKFSFEPKEPSFELNFERSRRSGIKVEAWIDSGNAKTGFYTWDAAGIRFFTTDEKLADFVNELKASI